MGQETTEPTKVRPAIGGALASAAFALVVLAVPVAFDISAAIWRGLLLACLLFLTIFISRSAHELFFKGHPNFVFRRGGQIGLIILSVLILGSFLWFALTVPQPKNYLAEAVALLRTISTELSTPPKREQPAASVPNGVLPHAPRRRRQPPEIAQSPPIPPNPGVNTRPDAPTDAVARLNALQNDWDVFSGLRKTFEAAAAKRLNWYQKVGATGVEKDLTERDYEAAVNALRNFAFDNFHRQMTFGVPNSGFDPSLHQPGEEAVVREELRAEYRARYAQVQADRAKVADLLDTIYVPLENYRRLVNSNGGKPP